MKQNIVGRQYGDLNGTQYGHPFGNLMQSNSDLNYFYAPIDFTARNLVAVEDIDAAVWTWLVDNVASTLTATSTSGVALDSTHSVAVTAGQQLRLKRVGGLKRDWIGYPVSTVVEIETADLITSLYAVGAGALAGGVGTIAAGLLGGEQFNGAGYPSTFFTVSPIAGVLTDLAVSVEYPNSFVDPTMGVRLTVKINDVLQDGTAGTQDTRQDLYAIAPADTIHVARLSGLSVPIAVGDTVEIQKANLGGLDRSHILSASCAIASSTAGDFAICGGNGSFALSAVAPIYGSMPSFWNTSEAGPGSGTNPPATTGGSYNVGGVTAMSLTGLIAKATNPAVGATITLALRVGFAVPALQPIITITAADTGVVVDSDVTHIVPVLYLQKFDTKAAQTLGATAAPVFHWSYAAHMPARYPPTPGTTRTYALRRLRRFALPFADNKYIFLKRLEILAQMGVGLTAGPTSAPVQGQDPQLMVRISKDGGSTWGDEFWLPLGKLGDYSRRAYATRLGRGRNLVVEITDSDPVYSALIEAFIESEVGTS